MPLTKIFSWSQVVSQTCKNTSHLKNCDCFPDLHLSSKLELPVFCGHQGLRDFWKKLVKFKKVFSQKSHRLHRLYIQKWIKPLGNINMLYCFLAGRNRRFHLESPIFFHFTNGRNLGCSGTTGWNSNTRKWSIGGYQSGIPLPPQISKRNAEQWRRPTRFSSSRSPQSLPLQVWILHKLIKASKDRQEFTSK